MNVLEGWRINEIESKVNHAHSEIHKIYGLRSDVDNMQYTLRQLGSEVNGLRDLVQALRDENIEIQRTIDALKEEV